MPELPEVETIARGADLRLRGERIVRCWFAPLIGLYKTPADLQCQGLEGRSILGVHRTGKHMVFELGPRGRAKVNPAEPSAQWIVHLGMTGRLLVGDPRLPLAPHTHVRLDLANGQQVRYVDPRRFGRLEFRDLSTDAGFTAAGQEPLTVGRKIFASLFAGRKVAIKAALLNQHLLTGVGNIYADESLFVAGIRPDRPSGTLTAEELERLRLALRRVLRASIKVGGTSVSDYVDAAGEPGLFQLQLRVYQRTGQPCLRCGQGIERTIIGGRSTHSCGRCQV